LNSISENYYRARWALREPRRSARSTARRARRVSRRIKRGIVANATVVATF
jgi:hypothetical protein